MGVDTLKAGTSTRCISCALKDQTNRNGYSQANPILKYFYDTYSVKDGNTLWALYDKRYEEHTSTSFPDGIPFEEAWKTNYKAFAEYIVALLDFDKWLQYQLDRIDNNKGYIEGNLRFVLPKVNARNKPRIRTLVFKDIEYYYADFVKLVTGVEHCKSVYRFLQHRIVPKTYTINQTLRALYNDRTIWPNESTEKHFCDWYESQFKAKPRKGITDI